MLTDQDEHLHSPPRGALDGWQENLFFICWDTSTRSGLLCHIQRVPFRGEQEARLVVVCEGEAASVTVEGPYADGVLVDGFNARAVDPYRRWDLSFRADAESGTGPLGLFATSTAGRVPVSAEVTIRSELPVADFAEGLAAVVEGMRSRPDGPQMGDQQHYEQGGTWTGTVTIGDLTYEGGGLMVRDHSWGIRREHHGFRAFWTASCLDGGAMFCNAIGIPGDSGVIGIGAVATPSGVDFTRVVSAHFEPEPGIGTYGAATVGFGSPIDLTLQARTQIHLPILLPHSGPDRYDNNAISEVRAGGLTGFGVMEWATVLDPASSVDLRRLGVRVSH